MTKRLSNTVISFFLIILSAISMIGAFNQLAVIQGTLSVKKNIIYTLVILAGIFICIFRKRLKYLVNYIFSNYKIYLSIFVIVCLLLIIYQVNVIEALTGEMELDPAFVYNLILQRPTVDTSYFSWYPNLLFLLNIENAIYHVLGTPSMDLYLKYLSYINMVLIDSGLALIYFTVKKQINKKYAFFSLLIGICLYGITPYIVIPYSDNWAFFCCALFIFLLNILYTNGAWDTHNFIDIIIMGGTSALLFKIKPSIAIGLIATIIVFILIVIGKIKTIFNDRNKIKRLLVLLSVFLIPFITTFEACNYYATNNGLVRIEKNQGASPLHFMAMGLHGDGQYWEKFTKKDQFLSKSERKKYEIRTIKKDILDFGSWSNFINFLINKQQSNTGLASWQRNTGPVSWNLSPKLKLKNQFQKFIRKTFTKGDFFYWNGSLVFIQLVWCMVILLLILSYSIDNYFVQTIKYTIVGGFTFLLLFEGGVSRYMIQYLPFVIVLVPYGLLSVQFGIRGIHK